MVWRGAVVRCGVWGGAVWCGVVWCGVGCDVVWCGMVWCGVVVCLVVVNKEASRRRKHLTAPRREMRVECCLAGTHLWRADIASFDLQRPHNYITMQVAFTCI